MPSLGWQELLLILLIVIIIFGVGKLPEIGGALGKGIREFRSNATDPGDDGAPVAEKKSDKKEAVRVEPVKEEL
ncbi:MAG: twin-arginine translocase TatA/TatE family subunit [Chloroflexi bacterium]|nr:MAG: twin-arginine translocase TatA/TatE family subunit [Chloroflexota bacterium]